MYIQFRLPMGSGGMAAQHINHLLNQELDAWATQHDITYKKKIIKYSVRVTFDDERDYTVFAMTWNPKKNTHWFDYEFIEPMNVDRS